MSKMFKKDEVLLSTLMSLPTVEARAAMVQQLHPEAVRRLCAHLKKIVNQSSSHRIADAESRRIIGKSLKPHAQLVRRITDFNRKQYGSGLRSQKGGAIISLILAAVVPLLADLAIKAFSK